MSTITQRIASAFVVLCGRYGDVTKMAHDREQSRQSLYREASQVANAVDGTAVQSRIDELQRQLAGQQAQIQDLQERLEHAIEITRDSRVGKGRPAGSLELRVSPSPSKPKFQGRNWGIPIAGNYLCQIQFPVSGYILINRSASACSASASVTWKNVVCLGSPATTQPLRQRVPR